MIPDYQNKFQSLELSSDTGVLSILRSPFEAKKTFNCANACSSDITLFLWYQFDIKTNVTFWLQIATEK